MEVDKSLLFVNCEHTLVPLFFGRMAASLNLLIERQDRTDSIMLFDHAGLQYC